MQVLLLRMGALGGITGGSSAFSCRSGTKGHVRSSFLPDNKQEKVDCLAHLNPVLERLLFPAWFPGLVLFGLMSSVYFQASYRPL